MGMTSAVKLRAIVDIAELATAIEFVTAAQALEYRSPLVPGIGVKAAYEVVRKHVAPAPTDRSMSGDIERIVTAIRSDEFRGEK